MRYLKDFVIGLCAILIIGAGGWFVVAHAAQKEKQTTVSIPLANAADVPAASDINSGVQWQAPKFLPAGCTAELVTDKKTGKIVYQKNINALWPVASLAKTVSALVVDMSSVDWSATLTTEGADMDVVRQNTKPSDVIGYLHVEDGSKIRARDALYASLVGSADNSAIALTRLVSPDYHVVVEKMNALARQNNLAKTHFTEPSGIDLNNISTAKEFMVLWSRVLQDDVLAKVMQTGSYTFTVEPPVGVREEHTVRNTNKIMHYNKRMIAGKTGYLNESGLNLAFWFTNKKGASRLGIILGCGSEHYLERRAARLMQL